MSKITLTEAARLSGRSRTYIYQLKNNGTLTVKYDADGKPYIEPSEYSRVFESGERTVKAKKTDATLPVTNSREMELLQAQIDELKRDKEFLQQQLKEQQAAVNAITKLLEYKKPKKKKKKGKK